MHCELGRAGATSTNTLCTLGFQEWCSLSLSLSHLQTFLTGQSLQGQPPLECSVCSIPRYCKLTITLSRPPIVTEPSPLRGSPACAKRAAYPDPVMIPDPESLTAQAAYTEALLPGSGSGPNCFQALGSSPGLLQDATGSHIVRAGQGGGTPVYVCGLGLDGQVMHVLLARHQREVDVYWYSDQ